MDAAAQIRHAYRLILTEDLRPYDRNPRTHSAEQVEQLRASIRAFGFTNPLLVDEFNRIIAGHGRWSAARLEGHVELPCIVITGLTDAQRRALVIADNQLALNAAWDLDLLKSELAAIDTDEDFDLSVIGFSDVELKELLDPIGNARGPREADDVPELPARAVSRHGEVWLLHDHRVMCGDSTDAAAVALLVAGAEKSCLLHADPPYGMGKESDGIANDNLYADKLDAFQMAWWRTWREHLTENASAYIWGNPVELWRLWLAHLSRSERMTYRNEIVWDKGSGFGQHAADMRSYSVNTERCLFLMLGEQSFGNVNKDDYWEGFEPIRSYLEAEAKRAALDAAAVKRICGVGMYGHWFSKSQWTMIPARHYAALVAAADGSAFTKPYAQLRAQYDGDLSTGDHLGAKREFYATRAYFDNAHDNMNEIWQFGRVAGEECYGHATPKPVAMIERCLKSSSREADVVLEPFGGTGSTLIAAEACGRVCYSMELEPTYVDVIVERWQQYTGQVALLEGASQTFDTIKAERHGDA